MTDLVYRLRAEVFAQESFPEPEDVERRLVNLLAEAADAIEGLGKPYTITLVCSECRSAHQFRADARFEVISFDCIKCGHRTSEPQNDGKNE